MKTCGKVLSSVLLIFVCTLALNHAIAQVPVNQQPLVKGNDVTTDMGLNLPYTEMTEQEIAKLELMLSQKPTEMQVTPTAKNPEVITDLGSGIPYQGLTEAETQKLEEWQNPFTPSEETTAIPKVEVVTDEGAGQPFQGLNSAEKSKLEAMTSNHH